MQRPEEEKQRHKWKNVINGAIISKAQNDGIWFESRNRNQKGIEGSSPRAWVHSWYAILTTWAKSGRKTTRLG